MPAADIKDASGNGISTSNPLPVTQAGSVASGATDSGNPVKVGGVYNSTKPTLTTGQRGDLQLGSRGATAVQLLAADSPNAVGTLAGNADGLTGAGTGLVVVPYNAAFVGGASGVWDRVRTPNIYKVLASTAIGSEVTVWTPTTGRKFRLMGMILSSSAAVSIIFKDNTSGTTILQIPKLLVDTPIVISLDGNGILSAAANNVLTATSSGAANLIATFYGTEE